MAAFAASPEAADNRAEPARPVSRRVIGALATELGAARFSFEGPPAAVPGWAMKAEPVHGRLSAC